MALLHQTACCLHLEDTILPYIILLLRKNNGTLEGGLTVIKFRGQGVRPHMPGNAFMQIQSEACFR